MIQPEKMNSELSMAALCAAFAVSVSGYYAWLGRDATLGAAIERVWMGLREQGICTSRKRVERLIRQRGLRLVRA